MNILLRLKAITTFVFDMDGVLTDGSLLISPDGSWTRSMNIKDGYAMQLAMKLGYRIIVISGSESDPVAGRLIKLGIKDVFMKITDKESCLKEYMTKNKIDTEQILFMGDDIPDYLAMKASGFPCCPADAAIEIKKISAYISGMRGGYGCVRDVIEKVLKLNNKWPLNTSVTAT